jgi:hypothetical protein
MSGRQYMWLVGSISNESSKNNYDQATTNAHINARIPFMGAEVGGKHLRSHI